jgi:hypothetical protein
MLLMDKLNVRNIFSEGKSISYKAMTTVVCYVLLIVRKQHFTCFSPVPSVWPVGIIWGYTGDSTSAFMQ